MYDGPESPAAHDAPDPAASAVPAGAPPLTLSAARSGVRQTASLPPSAAAPPARGGLLLLLLVLALSGGAAACGSDPGGPDPFEAREVGVVVNSVELSVTIFSVEDPAEAVTVGLGADGSPVGLAVRGGLAAIPMGIYPAVVVVDLTEGVVLRSIGLPEGSGATGAAFLNDSIVLVSNPGRNTVTPVNILAGSTAAEIPTGIYPEDMAVHAGRIFVVNAELDENFQPARSGTVTVLDSASLEPLGTIELSGENPGAIVASGSRLYVLNAGRFLEGTGSLSVLDPVLESEIDHHEGFGEFPGGLAVGPGGDLFIASFSFGVAVWDPATGSFIRAPDDAVQPGGAPSASAVAFDSDGRPYALAPGDCQAPSEVHRLTPGLEDDVAVPVGICPLAITFTEIEVPADPD